MAFANFKINPVRQEGKRPEHAPPYGPPPAAPQGFALARFFTRANYWDSVYRGPRLVHPVRNPNHWTGPRASS